MKKEKASLKEDKDCLDAVDRIDGEIGFLFEIVQLLQAASSNREEWGDITITNITADMHERLKRIKKCSMWLADSCRKGEAR